MADFELEMQKRTVTGKKVGRLRRDGLVPAIIYGPHIESIPVQVEYRPLENVLKNAGGTNLIDVKVEGKTHTVLTRSVQRDVLRREIIHVDFFAVDQSAKITTSVPVHYVGESPVVDARLGILVHGASTLTVETLPRNLINRIEIDLSRLDTVGASITAGDIDLGPDVTILNNPEELIVFVQQTSAARAEEELEAEAGAASGAEPEVIHKGKEQDADF